jgi:NADH-quinone oxidoreductase subunit C
MSGAAGVLLEDVRSALGASVVDAVNVNGEVTLTVMALEIHAIALKLRDTPSLAFEQLLDVCGVDYSDYGNGGWKGPRFAVVYHLLSIKHNRRLRLKVFLPDEENPRLATVTDIWASANWYEREAFDLYGILFEGHPDMRRLLTDYGFIGYPFRKDFPLEGHVEMRYDPQKQRVIYEPVSIEPRVLVPRVIRHDNRYEEQAKSTGGERGD